MGKVILDMTISLDGFSAGPDVSIEQPMGRDGERLHQWIFDDTAINTKEKDEMFQSQGAVILGKRTFDLGERHWGGNTPFGTPSFVLTHKAREKKVTEKGGIFNFINNGIETALEQATVAAGNKNVLVMGGADTAQQFIKAGLVDELHIRIVNVLLNDGVRLFETTGGKHIELERIKLVEAQDVTHFTFRVVKMKLP